jgi:serine/threonine-protein kinase
LPVTAPARKSGTYELPCGTTLGKYEIIRRIATGGMAEIYLARSRGTAGFEKLVVLKRIMPSLVEDPAFVQMFLDEARLAATLQHPNIADVYDVGEEAGAFFFTMEYVHGQDVRAIRITTRKRGEVVPLDIALAIVEGTCAALDYTHDKTGPDGQPLGLIHRDVSASNVLVSYDGAVKLVDFGIARASSSHHKTQTGALKGKLPYMSPEQCKALPMDRRSDLFSLGVLLYELTVGRRPFRGESDFAIMDAIVYQGAQRPSEIVESYPEELEEIVMKLLQRVPSDRYETAEQVLHDLDQFVAQHRLRLPVKALSKHMRSLFTDKIAAWEQAQQQGVPFAEHVALTATAESVRSELVTPPSTMRALSPRTLEISEVIAAEPETVAQLPLAPDLAAGKRRLLSISAGVVIGLGAAIGGYLFVTNKSSPAPAVEAQTIPMTATPPTTPPAAAPPAAAPPAAAPPVAEPPVNPEPVAESTTPPTESPAVTKSAPARIPPRAIKSPKPRVVSRHKPDEPKPPTTPPPPKPEPPKPKETKWDLDSPVLPQ